MARLVRVHTIELYPYGGHFGQRWDDDPGWDALARSARRVAERYSELVHDAAGCSVPARSG